MKRRFDHRTQIQLVLTAAILLSLPLYVHPSVKRVLVLPLKIYSERPMDHIREGVSSMLASRLSAGGLSAIGQGRIERYLTEEDKEGIISKKRAEALTRKLDADYAVFGTVTAVGNNYSLDLSLLKSGEQEASVTRFSKVVAEDRFIPTVSDLANEVRAAIQAKGTAQQPVPQPPKPPKTGPEIFSRLEHDKEIPSGQQESMAFKPASKPKPLRPTGTIPLHMEVMSFDMGDLDGDGTVELVVVDRTKMLVYRQEGKTFVLIDTRKASWGEEFFKVSVGDMDHNGTAEIFVVCLYGMRARTSVYERIHGFRNIGRKIGHIRVIQDPIEKTSLLLFQGSEVTEFFSGPMYYMNYSEGGEFIKGKELPEMRGAQFYTIMPFELDKDGSMGWLGFGEANLYEQSRLNLWGKGGEILWKGETDLGGTNNAVRVGEKLRGGLPPRISFNSRLVFADIDGDGEKEVVTLANTSLMKHSQNFKVYTKSRLIAYERQGLGFSPGWATGEIDDCITELQVYGQKLFLAAHKGKISNIGKKSGVIMWFE